MYRGQFLLSSRKRLIIYRLAVGTPELTLAGTWEGGWWQAFGACVASAQRSKAKSENRMGRRDTCRRMHDNPGSLVVASYRN